MKRLWNRLDLQIIALLGLVVIAAWPFLSRASLPAETDAELHIFRLAELARLVRGGVLYPRWAPNFYFGFGYPIFNYYAPLAYYLGLPATLISGMNAVLGVKVVFVLSFLLGAAGVYAFVRDWWGRSGAIVGAAAFIFSPYFLYVDPHARGDLAETLSFGLFPLSLWALGRLQRTGSAISFLAAVLSTAAVIVSHNLMAMVFFALLLAWVLWENATRSLSETAENASDRPGIGLSNERGIWMILALGLAVGVAAFFWLPVALEQDAVNLNSLIGDGGHFDFRNHFLGIGELLGPTQWLDWGATEPEFTLNLGMAQWLLSMLGVAGIVTGFARHRGQALFFALSAAGLIFMMTAASTPIWEVVPLLPFLQFPWRLLGPAAAVLAILAGIGVQSLLDCLAHSGDRHFQSAGHLRVVRNWLAVLLILLVLVLALPLTMPPPWPEVPWDTSARAVMAIERQGRWLGTTSTADFVPRTVEILPRPNDAMIDQFFGGAGLDRVNRATLPEGTTAEGEVVTPLHTRYRVSSDRGFLLRLFLFAFPGWEARVDGVAVETELGRPEGFLVVPVPEGEHTVDVSFENTAERKVAWLITAAAIIVSGGLAWLLARRVGAGTTEVVTTKGFEARSPACDTYGSSRRLVPAVVVAALFLMIFLFAHWQGLFHYRSRGWTAIPAEHDTFADFGGQMALIGYEAPARAERGETVEVTLYWKAERDMDVNFQVFLHLLDATGTPPAQSDKLNPGEFPTSRWPMDKYVRDVHRLRLPATLAPGNYVLSTGMWVQSEGWRLPLLNSVEEQIADNLRFAELEVR